jgi:CBS domain-containing protein
VERREDSIGYAVASIVVRARYSETEMPRTTSLIGPSFQHATVADAMRTGILTCSADTSLREIAEMMASYRIHAVVVEGAESESAASGAQGWGIVSDVELTRAAARGELQATAGQLAGSNAIMITPADELKRAAELMSEHGVSHLIVSRTPTARPVGIISTLDVAGALAWGRG